LGEGPRVRALSRPTEDAVYTRVSDQFSVFAERTISCSVREAIYVLDGLLENDTILRPREHYTDTHGFTEQLFGLCYLLGFSFMPTSPIGSSTRSIRNLSYGCGQDPTTAGTESVADQSR